MIYDIPIKGEDGLYSVKLQGEKKFIQLNDVKIVDVSGDDITLELTERAVAKIDEIDEENKVAAVDNSESWFGKKLKRSLVDGVYTRSVADDGSISVERIEAIKVFSLDKEEMDIENIQPDKSCDVILEFAGIWFAKKTFGSLWNMVQLRIHPDPEPIPPQPSYPEGYAFVDEEE